MTAEQLQAARAARWRQDKKPILTLEEAESWFLQHPLSPFLPLGTQLPAPAPSFVEACFGEANPTPPAAAVERATELLAWLMESHSVIGLNLFGSIGERPDFLVHAQALPFVVCLRVERNWKQAPLRTGGHQVSPLVAELWKLLEEAEAITAATARERLGRELTDLAVMRGLSALWQPLRAIPVLQTAGRPALWERLQNHYRPALLAGSSSSQVTAISLLVSIYLQSVYAATEEEIEIYLSPLVSRSRIREALRGLSATKQIHSFSMDARTFYFLENALDEFAPVSAPERVELPPRRPRISPVVARRSQEFSHQPAPPSRLSGPTPAQTTAAAEGNIAPRKVVHKPAAGGPRSPRGAGKWKGPGNQSFGAQRKRGPGTGTGAPPWQSRKFPEKQRRESKAHPPAREAASGRQFPRPPRPEEGRRPAFREFEGKQPPAKRFGSQQGRPPRREAVRNRPGDSRVRGPLSSSSDRPGLAREGRTQNRFQGSRGFDPSQRKSKSNDGNSGNREQHSRFAGTRPPAKGRSDAARPGKSGFANYGGGEGRAKRSRKPEIGPTQSKNRRFGADNQGKYRKPLPGSSAPSAGAAKFPKFGFSKAKDRNPQNRVPKPWSSGSSAPKRERNAPEGKGKLRSKNLEKLNPEA